MNAVKHHVALNAGVRFVPGTLPMVCGAMPRVDLHSQHVFLRLFGSRGKDGYLKVKDTSLSGRLKRKVHLWYLWHFKEFCRFHFGSLFWNIYVNKCVIFWKPLISWGKAHNSSEGTARNPVIVILCWEVHCGESGLLRLWIHIKAPSCLTFEANYNSFMAIICSTKFWFTFIVSTLIWKATGALWWV